VKEDLTIRDMTDLMETMNGDHIIIASKMTGVVITGLTEIAKTVLVTTIVTVDMVTVMGGITITVMEEDTITTVTEGDTTIAPLLMETTVLLTGIIIITVHTEIMIVNTIALARKDIVTGL
jgi:hypothetical protein